MLKVAITGNIGSGKTTVCTIFKSLGIPIFNADTEARQLYQLKEVQEEVQSVFGPGVFNEQNKLNTKALAEIIFNNRGALAKINAIIHPRTVSKYHQWLEEHTDEKYTLHESAILFENKLQHHFDKTINVSAPADLRLKRVMERDNISYDDVIARMKNQLPEEEKNELADFVIFNDEHHFLIPQIIDLDKSLKAKK